MTATELRQNGVVPPQVTVTLFGRPSIEVDGRAVALKGAIPAAIVARLALAAGDQLALDELVDEVWAAPPPTAAGTLRANISRLRSAGLDDAIQGGRGGYSLAARVDVLDFLRTAQTALSTGLLDDLRLAESLWAGDPLRGLDAPFAAGVVRELRDARRRVAERLSELRLGGGDLHSVLETLPAVVAAHPTHEEPTRLLATALARSGRMSDALALIDAFARRLSEEEGLDPSPALTALRMSIVRQDPVVVPTAGPGRARQHGVPLPITRFIGRRRELDLVARARHESRLVTLTGPGGVGKSRLAIESLREAAGSVDGEQWVLELASFTSGMEMLSALRELVGASSPNIDVIAGQLAGQGTLLVIDNAEHLRDEVASLVSSLLAASPGLSVLVTSREALRIPGERLIPVSTMHGDDAVALFGERAADALPGFVMDATTAATVRHLSHLLDGLPLALELTAARLDVMDLAELIRSLESDELLTLRGPDGGRHGSLQNTIDWSVRLLRPAELELLAQLANFAGPVSIDAIAGICVLADADVRETATALAHKSLLAVEGGGARSRRYRLLESVKLYARTLPTLDDRGAWRIRHSRWFADRVDQLEPTLRGIDSTRSHDELDGDRADRLVALDTAMALSDRDTAVRLAGGQAWHWFMNGTLIDGRRYIDGALALPGEPDPYFDARAIWGAVRLIYRSGDKHAGEAYAARGLPLAAASGDATLHALFLACNAMWAAETDVPRALRIMAEAEAVMASGIADWAVSEVLTYRSILFLDARKPANAMRDLQAAVASAVAAHHDWAAGTASWSLAHLLIAQRRERDAVDQLVSSFDLVAHRDPLAVILALHAGALALTGVERQREAAQLYGAVDRLGAAHGFPRSAINDDRHEAHRTRAKQSLTTTEWNAAYREGTRLSLDDAVAFYRAVAGRLPPVRP